MFERDEEEEQGEDSLTAGPRFHEATALTGRIEWHRSGSTDKDGVVLYRLPRPTPHGRTVVRLSPIEFLDRLAALFTLPGREELRHWASHK